MKQQNEKPQRINKPCTLLSQDENDTVFSLLGRRCQTMSTAVVQLFTTEAPTHSTWVKRLSGIACFVKDSSKRSYFIRIYCMIKHEMFLEEEMYETILINKPREFMITFEGQKCMVALSFASDAEANFFYKTATTTVANRSKRRRSRKFSPNHNEQSKENGIDSGQMMSKNPNAGIDPFYQLHNNAGLNKKIRPNKKLTKADISTPTNFKHLAHIGWNENKKEISEVDEGKLKEIFDKANISQEQLDDKKTRDFIYGFIQSYNIPKTEIEQQSNSLQQPPPVPSRQMPRMAPAPPSVTGFTCEIDVNECESNQKSSLGPCNIGNIQKRPPAELPTPREPPSRPPPMKMEQTTNIPAPPPMPSLSQMQSTSTQSQPFNKPAQSVPKPTVGDDSKDALLKQIQGVIILRPVDPATLSTGSGSGSATNARSALLDEIVRGIPLRPVEWNAQRNSDDTKRVDPVSDLAGALLRALEDRKRALNSSEDESESSENDEWD